MSPDQRATNFAVGPSTEVARSGCSSCRPLGPFRDARNNQPSPQSNSTRFVFNRFVALAVHVTPGAPESQPRTHIRSLLHQAAFLAIIEDSHEPRSRAARSFGYPRFSVPHPWSTDSCPAGRQPVEHWPLTRGSSHTYGIWAQMK
jgi:hypothetical protein